jgi:hypothetical protein
MGLRLQPGVPPLHPILTNPSIAIRVLRDATSLTIANKKGCGLSPHPFYEK